MLDMDIWSLQNLGSTSGEREVGVDFGKFCKCISFISSWAVRVILKRGYLVRAGRGRERGMIACHDVTAVV